MTAYVVVNLKAGRTGQDWPDIKAALEAAFPLMNVAISHRRGQVAHLVRTALKDGRLDIIAVGGDGTINEAVNGFFENGAPISPDAVLGFVSSGRASDFRRTFGIKPGYQAAIARLRQSRIKKLDIGHVACLSPRGEPVSRYFANVASFGLTGKIAAPRLTGLPGRALAAAAALFFWRPQPVRLFTDNGYDEIAGISDVAVANGRWFGGGIRVAPQAEPGDGLFDIVITAGAPRRRILRALSSLRAGKAPVGLDFRLLRAAHLTAAPTLETDGAVYVEADGEKLGQLPATFEIIPGAINLRC